MLPQSRGPASGQTGQGTLGIHMKDKRCICRQCRKTFTPTTGTVFSRLRNAAELVTVVTLLAHGCPLSASIAAGRLDERTVADWWAHTGQQGQAVGVSSRQTLPAPLCYGNHSVRSTPGQSLLKRGIV